MIDISQLQKYVDKVMDQELRKDANITQELMRGEVPIDTGTLQASIGILKLNDGYRIGHRPALLIAKSGENYGDVVYFGAGKRRPNHWIERTIAKLPSNINSTRSSL